MRSRAVKLLDLDVLARAAECLRVLGHPVRLRMVQMLLNGTHSVGELAEACEIPSHVASEHLRLMQHCGFLSRTQEGRYTYYEVAEPHLADILECIEDRYGKGK